jgi:hypothetical protein
MPKRIDPALFELKAGRMADYAIFPMGQDVRILSWNRGAQRIKGYEEWEIPDQTRGRSQTTRCHRQRSH